MRSYEQLNDIEREQVKDFIDGVRIFANNELSENIYAFSVFESVSPLDVNVYIQGRFNGYAVNFSGDLEAVDKHTIAYQLQKRNHEYYEEWRSANEAQPRDNVGTRINKDKKRRMKVLKSGDYTCQHCGHKDETGKTLHADHIVPLSRGGADHIDNLQVLCATCNFKKGNKLESEL